MTLRWRTGCKPARIGVFQRTVVNVAVPIKRLAVERRRNRGISRDHSPHRRVIDPAIQVHQREVVQLLLVGITPVGVVLERCDRILAQVIVPVRGIPSQPKRIKTHGLNHAALVIGDRIHTAQVIVVQVIRTGGAILVNRMYCDDLAIRHDVVPVFRRAAAGGDHLEHPADVGRRRGGTVERG